MCVKCKFKCPVDVTMQKHMNTKHVGLPRIYVKEKQWKIKKVKLLMWRTAFKILLFNVDAVYSSNMCMKVFRVWEGISWINMKAYWGLFTVTKIVIMFSRYNHFHFFFVKHGRVQTKTHRWLSIVTMYWNNLWFTTLMYSIYTCCRRIWL